MKRYSFSLLALLLLGLLTVVGCSKGPQLPSEEEGYRIYYINKEDTAVVTELYEPKNTSAEGQLTEFLGLLQGKPENTEIKAAIPQAVEILDYKLENGQLSLNFDMNYLEMDKLYEILCRSAIVRTLCQIPEVEYVSILVADSPLLDSNQTPVGPLNADNFIENTGNEINMYTVATLKLFFANDTGDKLVAEQVDIRYSSNMSIEKLVVEQLIRGPVTEEVSPTIPVETKIVSVSTKDGICYVNLDEGFMSQGYNVLEAIPIYSIVNSLTELPGISKVQILINGETNRIYREKIRFETIFERNLDLIEE